MFIQGLDTGTRHSSGSPADFAKMEALRLYELICKRSLLEQIRSLFSKQDSFLSTLEGMNGGSTGQPKSRYLGRRTVSLKAIRGSDNKGRTRDFDASFKPMHAHTESRWLGIAACRIMGKTLPPVSLIQHGSTYFVQDGHHRISVALALGDRDIEAEVTCMGPANLAAV